MNEDELREFMATRKPSPNVERKGVAGLTCYGCAHASALAPPPGCPSGERPCQACVRNPDLSKIQAAYESSKGLGQMIIDDRGNARCFAAAGGTQYNGVPMVHHPMDRYVTLDQRDQEAWLDAHPEYKGSVRFSASGTPEVIDE